LKKYLFFILCVFITATFLCSVGLANANPENIRIYDKGIAILENATYSLSYEKPEEKYANTFIVIRNCDEVIIDGITIVQNNPNYLAEFSILIEDCKKVTVKNSIFKGTCRYHLRIEGCEEVFIENIKITGFDYGAEGLRCGGGIWVNNGESRPDGSSGLWSLHPKNLLSLTIRNCIISNNLTTDVPRNLDGILIHSASNALLSGCIFENWLAGDAALDVSHRRIDNEYTNKHFTIQQCVFRNNKHVKSAGSSNISNTIQWVNNIYTDTKIGSYHEGWKEQRTYESYMFTEPTFGFWRNWSSLEGLVQIRGCLLHVAKGTLTEMYKLSAIASADALNFIQPNYNIYSLQAEPKFWLTKQVEAEEVAFPLYIGWAAWQASGRDKDSILLIRSGEVVVKTKNGFTYPIYTGTTKPNKTVIENPPLLDFFGNARNDFCYGAVCPGLEPVEQFMAVP
jgi:hypothetical protein